MTDKRYERARQRVEELRAFYVHLTLFVLVNAILVAVDLLSGGGLWFFWPLLGWGIGLGFHAVSVSERAPFGAQWEERKIRELVDKDEQRHGAGGTPSA